METRLGFPRQLLVCTVTQSPGTPNDQTDDLLVKKQRLAQLKMEKERLEAELAAAESAATPPAASAAPKPPPVPPPAPKKKSSPPVAQPAASKRSTRSVATQAAKPAAKAERKPTASTSSAPRKRAPLAATLPAADKTQTVERPPAEKPSTRKPPAEITVAKPAAAHTAERAPSEFATDSEYDARPKFSIRAAPPWLVSLVVHAGILLCTALFTFATLPPTEHGFVIAEVFDEQEDAIEQFSEVEIEKLEEVELQELTLESSVVDAGMIDFGDIAAEVEPATADVGDIQVEATTIGEIGALFGTEGKGMSSMDEGMKAAGSFFGVKSTGRKFVFVVDNSNSMGRGKFETALMEMVRTVEAMKPEQYFYVIFFSDTAYKLFHPNSVPRYVPATPENKEKLRVWLYSVQLCLRTDGKEAMTAALALYPDVIYVLGDGAFTDKTEAMLTAPHERYTVIHTLGMDVDDRGRKEMTAIAAANNGRFTPVVPNPAVKAMAKANPIKRNNVRGPVWGIKLPVGKR